jgi:hypothetical protein
MNTPNPQHDFALVIIGGLVADVSPTNLPVGAAAVCTDMDFTVGSTFSRDGIQNVYVYDGADQQDNCGLGVDITVTDAASWSNPNNISFDTIGTYATISLNGTPVTPSENNATNAFTYTLFGATAVTTVTPSSIPINVGDTCFLMYYVQNEFGNTDQTIISGIVDNQGNTWQLLFPTQNPNSHLFFQVFYARMGTTIPVSSSLIITATVQNATEASVNFASFANFAGLGALDQTQHQSSSASSDPVSGPSITIANTELLISFVWDEFGNFPLTGPTGWTQDNTNFGHPNTSPVSISAAWFLAAPGSYADQWTSGGSASAWSACLAAFVVDTVTTPAFSDILRANTFALSVPLTSSVLGIEVFVSGHQSASTTQLTIKPTSGGNPVTFALSASNDTFSYGGPGQFLGLVGLTPAQVNDPGFGFDITAQDSSGAEVSVSLYSVQLLVWYTPPGVENFDWVSTFEMENGDLFTLALDNTGSLWQEDVLNNPGVLTPFYTAVEPDTFAQGITYDDREFMAFSDRMNATDIPRQYNGQWVDRVSQVAPGAPPACTATTTDYDVVSITQPAAVASGGTGGPGISALLWSAGPANNHTAGNVITIYYGTPGAHAPASPADPNIIVGNAVYLAGWSDIPSGQSPNGTYIVNTISTTAGFGGNIYNTFTVTAPSTALANQDGIDNPPPDGTYNATLATLTTLQPIPNVQVGSQIVLAGVSPSTWDGSWTVLFTPNAAQLQITSTTLSSNVATYSYTIISGTAPTIGQQVTVVGTDNGDGIFNVSNAVISAVSPGSFSIPLASGNVSPAAEADAQAIVNGTIFQFDPGLNDVGTGNDPILGTGTGGTVQQPGNLGAGVRQAVVMFKTRNGAITGCSIPVTFSLTEDANSIVATNIPIGPPDVVARIVAFTPAAGAFFYYIPQPVTITSNGQKVTYTSTVVSDNTSTQATFTFTDAVLVQSIEIDIQGNNLFEQIELGSSLAFIAYSTRVFALGEQNKIQNLINLSFDGGYLPNPMGPLQPLGWTLDATFLGNGQLSVSPIFGNSYYILNATGSTIAGATGMIEQTAFQDYLQTPIVNINTQYGVRVTASCPGGISGGGAALVIDLFSPTFNRVYGSFSVLLASMSTEMEIFTGDLLTTEFATAVPSDLILRVYATGLLNNGDVMIDRLEPFDLSQPVLSTQLRGSYFSNFEAFDDVTGNLGCAVQNQQPIRNAFTLFDNLYIVKTKSFYSTTDNGVTEPNGWTVREVSNKVGTPSIYGVDVGEGWAIIVGRAGAYVFDGGQPIKFSPEIDPLWEKISWTYGYTIWVKNDTNNRRLSIGVPLPTPNQWMPKFPTNANPTQPNVILVCQYKEVMSSSALAGEGPVRQSYTGELKSFQLGRKWSVWSIEAAFADFVTRGDTSEPLFYCGDTDTAKIYEQITGTHEDDGEAIIDQYVTFPFLKSSDAQQLQAGLHNLVTEFATALVEGSGLLNVTVYPNTPDSPYAERLDPGFVLADPPPWGDTEMPVNVPGNRFFLGFETDAIGDWFDLSRVVLNVIMDPWAPTRGANE